jgi:hypothetical protein
MTFLDAFLPVWVIGNASPLISVGRAVTIPRSHHHVVTVSLEHSQ